MAKQAGESWLLVVDARRRPSGWVSVADLESAAGQSTVGEAPLAPYGHTFGVTTDSLRAALDATVLSPAGRAVGVDGDGRVVGVTSYDRLRVAIHAADEASQPGGSSQPGRAPQPGGASRPGKPS